MRARALTRANRCRPFLCRWSPLESLTHRARQRRHGHTDGAAAVLTDKLAAYENRVTTHALRESQEIVRVVCSLRIARSFLASTCLRRATGLLRSAGRSISAWRIFVARSGRCDHATSTLPPTVVRIP